MAVEKVKVAIQVDPGITDPNSGAQAVAEAPPEVVETETPEEPAEAEPETEPEAPETAEAEPETPAEPEAEPEEEPEAEPEGETPETPAEEPPAEEPEAEDPEPEAEPPKKAVEQLPARFVEQAQQALQLATEADRVIGRNPLLMAYYYRDLAQDRALSADEQALSDKAEEFLVKNQAAVPTALKSDEAVKAEADALFNQGKNSEATKLIAEHERKKVEAKQDAERAAQAAKDRQTRAQNAARAQVERFKSSVGDMQKAYPKLAAVDGKAKYGVRITDKALKLTMDQISAEIGETDLTTCSMTTLLEMGLARLDRHREIKARKKAPPPGGANGKVVARTKVPAPAVPAKKNAPPPRKGGPVAPRPQGGTGKPATGMVRVPIATEA